MPARLLPMWSFNSANRLAFMGFAIMFAAIARAAEPHVDPPVGATLPGIGSAHSLLAAREELGRVKASKSWRLTEPLRSARRPRSGSRAAAGR